MQIDLLYFDGCPSWQQALANLREVVGEGVAINLIRVETEAEAVVQQFSGSPTIRKDGVDIFAPAAILAALACRVYHTPQGPSGAPTVEMIRAALD